MKNVFKLALLLPFLMVFSCNNYMKENPIEQEEIVGDYCYSNELTVPVGTSVIFVEYNSKVAEIPVSPEIIKPNDGKYVEPWGKINLNLTSPVKTVFNAYYKINDKRVELIENGIINKPISLTKADASYVLSEPKEYQSTDLGFTTYHSSGVILFEDIWPLSNRKHDGKYDTDFNDLVLDYDIAAVVVPDELLVSDGWREEVRVVLHIRATSGTEVDKSGVILEGFNTEYVDSINDYRSFDSWQNPHGTLPSWTENTLQKKSVHNESVNNRPCVEIGSIYSMKEKVGAGDEEYTRINDNGSTFVTVLNPNVKKYWKEPKVEQYVPELADIYTQHKYTTLASTQKTGYYNVVPGYVNVNGGLYTYTVIYHMKNRSEMDDNSKKSVLDNMIDAVYKTTNQNFYIVTKDGTPIGLMGYEPYDAYVNKYNQVVAENPDKVDAEIPYKSKSGLIWALKCPTLTRHMWNKLPFSAAYPHYMNWIDTSGEENRDWYEKDVDGRLLSCWW